MATLKVKIEIVAETAKRRKKLGLDARGLGRSVRLVLVDQAYFIGVHTNAVKGEEGSDEWKLCIVAGPYNSRRKADAKSRAKFNQQPPVRVVRCDVKADSVLDVVEAAAT